MGDEQLAPGDVVELWLRVRPLSDEYGDDIPPARRLARLLKTMERAYGFRVVEAPVVHREEHAV
jgi:hypothetical protein